MLIGVGFAFAEKQPQPIEWVLKNSRTRARVLVQGTITKQIDFDNLILTDSGGSLRLDAFRVHQYLSKGDKVIVYGLYLGRITEDSARGKLEVLDFLPIKASDNPEKARQFIEKYGSDPVPAVKSDPVPAANHPAKATDKTVESRLKELDDLKAKNLLSDEEYKEQRKRILGSL